jgi:quercetin dioxygenase-like cupin family protein
MFHPVRNFRRGIVIAVALAGASLIGAPAFAGECPADQQKPNAREAVDVKPVGKTDTVIASIDLSDAIKLDGRLLRMRKVTVEPGGIVPWHPHADRPAILYILEGTIHEYASDCAVPIVHKAGDVVPESGDVSHWWKNLDDTTVVILAADLPTDPNDKNM